MNNKLPINELVPQLAAWINKNAKSPGERSLLLRRLTDCLAEALTADAPEADHITAPNAVVEVIDPGTGYLYRRYLELEYDENDNGLRLTGEDMAGKPSQIVFLSNTAIEKMHELQGLGPDEPRCED